MDSHLARTVEFATTHITNTMPMWITTATAQLDLSDTTARQIVSRANKYMSMTWADNGYDFSAISVLFFPNNLKIFLDHIGALWPD